MRAPALNTIRHATVALFLAIAAGLGISACGGSPGAATLLSDTFQSGKPIESGQIDLRFTLSGKGSPAFSKPLKLHISGPFESTGSKKLPRFALKLDLTAAGNTLQAGMVSAGRKLFVELEGTPFVVPGSAVKKMEEAYAEESSSIGSSKSTFAKLGIEPGEWLKDPVTKGTVTIDGEQADHIEATLDPERFLKDVDKLSGAAGSLGSAAGQAAGALSPKLISSLAKSIVSAKVDVYTGSSDHLLRRLELTAKIEAKGEASEALQGLTSANLQLDLSFSGINRHQSIVVPANAKPLSQLASTLSELGLVSASSGSGEGSRSAGSGSASSGEAPSSEGEGAGSEVGEGATSEGSGTSAASKAYIECVTKAGSNVEALQGCASLLKG